MAAKMWRGKVRIVSGMRRPDSGDEIEVRIARGLDGALVVDWNSGTDAFGQVRWLTIAPKSLDPASLCAALVDSVREDVGPESVRCEAHGLRACSSCFGGEERSCRA